MIRLNILLLAAVAFAATNQDSFKDQYCTDPRTMRNHAAYSEWADAYSCTRHRCQPGGRNLAIYTVGCKRVEAPESAIECEEVVEDTNMQFPFCCTRLRCLVVVRGEVWTRVLGQPWETLPAAPWSHMYKMKKPPPPDGSFLPNDNTKVNLLCKEDRFYVYGANLESLSRKSVNAAKMLNPAEGDVKGWDDATGLNVNLNGEGPIYELTSDAEDTNHDKVLRAAKITPTEAPDCNDVVPRSVVAPAPDIVIALSTNEAKEHKKTEGPRHKKKKTQAANLYHEEPEPMNEPDMLDGEDNLQAAEKQSFGSEEQVYANAFGVTEKVPFKDLNFQDVGAQEEEKKEEKPSNLQALVDAIGTRMRDIENVVQKMSEKAHQKSGEVEGSGEKTQRFQPAGETMAAEHHEEKDFAKKTKKPNRDEQYKRFSVRNRGSKYLHTTEGTTDLPLFIEDTNMNGYFSDASNTVLRRATQPKEPAAIYMAPVDTRRKGPAPEISREEETKKKKKHTHKKKKSKGRSHKKHHGKDEKRKKFNRLTSIELDKNMVSLEDSSVL